MTHSTSAHDRCKRPIDRFACGTSLVPRAALALREGEADP